MTYIAVCTTHGGGSRTKWLHGYPDFWSAVEHARYLPETLLPLPPKPERSTEGFDHLRASALHEWDRQCIQIKSRNHDRIKAVEYVKPFME